MRIIQIYKAAGGWDESLRKGTGQKDQMTKFDLD